MEKISVLFNHIFQERKLFMGVAIVMVVLYHLFCFCGNKGWTFIFYIGYTGVDIFMLLSGYGLCNSYKRNDIGTFYKRRIVRLMPLFGFMMIFATIVDSLITCRYDFSLLNLLCNMSSSSFYGLGGWYVEWYLCVLLMLCVLFPFIYETLEKCSDIIKNGYLLDILVVLVVFVMTLPLEWYYKCAIGRLPIFCVGLLYFMHKIDVVHIVRAYAIGSILAATLFVTHRLETFGVVYMLAPFIMLSIALIFHNVRDKFQRIKVVLEYLGLYTLEIYVANVILMKFRSLLSIESEVWVIYIVMQTLLSMAVICINKNLIQSK